MGFFKKTAEERAEELERLREKRLKREETERFKEAKALEKGEGFIKRIGKGYKKAVTYQQKFKKYRLEKAVEATARSKVRVAQYSAKLKEAQMRAKLAKERGRLRQERWGSIVGSSNVSGGLQGFGFGSQIQQPAKPMSPTKVKRQKSPQYVVKGGVAYPVKTAKMPKRRRTARKTAQPRGIRGWDYM